MKYKVLSNLKTSEKTYVFGEEIEMDKNLETTKHLVADSILELIKPKETEKVNYSEMKVSELRILAQSKGFDEEEVESIKKAELVALLEESEVK